MSLYEDRAGNLWINTEGQGVTRYKDDVFTTYTTEHGLPNNQVWTMYEDPAGNLKAQTAGGLVQWGDGTFQASTPAFGEPVIGPFQRTGSGAIWSDDDGKLRKVEPGRPTVELNPGNFVNSFYEDRAGRLWIGTREGHVLVYENGKLNDYSQKKGSQRFTHVRFFEDRKGWVWIAALGEGLFQSRDGH